MKDRDTMDTTIIGHILATMKDLGSHVMDIKAGLVSIEGKLDTKASKDDLAGLRLAINDKASREDLVAEMSRHSKNPAAHGFLWGITKVQWAKIGGLIGALTTLATAAAAYLAY
jgi:hypothetical protein